MTKRMLFILAVCVLTSACATQTFHVTGSPIGVASYEESQHFLLWGLAQEKVTTVRRACGKKRIRAVGTEVSVSNAILTMITLGIYAPKTAKVWCR